MSISRLRKLVSLLALCLVCTGLTAQNSRPLISVQGTLKDINGITVDDGERTFTFRLYNVASGGNALWEETAQVNINGGIYSHNLGSVELLNESNFIDNVYLGIEVDGNELSPRTVLTYSPYALSVFAAQRVARGGCSGQVGDVKYSILNPTQFASQNGDCWVPMDGRGMSGSVLAGILESENVPNMSGLFIRAQEYGDLNRDDNRTSSSPIAEYQGDTFKSHGHTIDQAGNHSHAYGDSWLARLRTDDQNGSNTADDFTGRYNLSPSGGFSDPQNSNNSWMEFENDGGDRLRLENTDETRQSSSNGGHTHNAQVAGQAETRPKNMNFYVYIRIN